jgi:YVTN family beta-propeller protein
MKRLVHRVRAARAALAFLILPACAVAHAAPFAYLAVCDADTVQVIDTATGELTADIPVGDCPTGVAVSRDGGRVYVANSLDDTLSVIDAATNTVDRVVAVRNRPTGVAVSPNGQTIYVTNRYDDSVSIIDTQNGDQEARVGVGLGPYGLAVTPDGRYVFVADRDQSLVSRIDTHNSNAVVHYSAQGNLPTDVAISPDGRRAYITNADSGTFVFIDIPTGDVQMIAPPRSMSGAPNRPIGVAIAADGGHLYFAVNDENRVVVMETVNNTVTGSIENVAQQPWGIAVTPDGQHLYVGSDLESAVAVVDIATHAINHVALAARPQGLGQFIGPAPDRHVSLCAELVDNGDAQFDIATFSITGTSDDSDVPGNLGTFDLVTNEDQTMCEPIDFPMAASGIAAVEQLPQGFVSAPDYPRWILRDIDGTTIRAGEGADTGMLDLSDVPLPFDLRLVIQNKADGDRIFADGFGP